MVKVRKHAVKKKKTAKKKVSRAKTPTRKKLNKSKPTKERTGFGGMKFSIYGRSKTGKTRLACSFQKRVLLVGAEKGIKSICTGWDKLPSGVYSLLFRGKELGIDFLPLCSSDSIDNACAIMQAGDYATGILDTAGGLQDIILKEILGVNELPIQKGWGTASRDQWATCGMQTKQRLKDFLDLSDVQDMDIVVIAHERNFDADNDSDVIFPTVGSALTPSVAGWLNGACDYIGQTHIREQVETKPIKIAGVKTTTSQKTGVIEYCLRIGPHPVYTTGFRVAPGITLPDSIIDPTYEKIDAIIQGGG